MKYIFVFFAFIYSLFCFSQNEKDTLKTRSIDSVFVVLQNKLKEAKTTNRKLEAQLAISYYHLSHDFSQSEPILNRILHKIKADENSINEKHIANLYGQLGIVNKRKGDYSKALAYYLKSKTVYEELKDTSNVANLYHNIAMVYRDLSQNKKAITSFKKTISLKSSLKEIQGVAIAYNMMGVSYRHSKKKDSALYCYDQAKILFKRINDWSNIPHVNSNLATLYQGEQNFAMALPIYLENLEIFKTNKEKSSLFSVHHNISRCYTYLNDHKKALFHNSKSIEISKSEGFEERLSKAYLRRSFIQKRAGNFKGAFESYRLYKKQYDKVFNSETIKKIQELELKHEYRQVKLADSLEFVKEKNELEIITKTERSKKQVYLLLLCIVLIAAAIISFLIRWNYKNKAKHLANKLALNDAELTKYTKELLNKKIEQEALNKEINALNDKLGTEVVLTNLQELANSKILTKADWTVFKQKFNLVYPLFLTQLKKFQFTESEERLLTLEKLNLNNTEISSILGIAPKSVVVTRYRLKKKLNIPKEVTLLQFLKNNF